MNVRVVAIQNYGPSGTMLLHSLLDDHADVLSLPGLYPVGIYGGWRRFTATLPALPTADDAVRFLMEWLRPLYDREQLEYRWGLAELGEHRDQDCCVSEEALHVELRRAVDELGATPGVERRTAVLAAYIAYNRCCGVDVSGRDLLVFPAHGSELAEIEELAADFPDVRVIHMIRDPVDSVFSTVKYNVAWQERWPTLHPLDPFRSAITQMTIERSPLFPREEPFHGVRPYSAALAPRSRALRLEDLHREPEQTMRAVAAWLGLDWSPSLLQSTFVGRRWWNRPGLRRVSGFRSDMSTTAGVSPLDRLRIAAATAAVRRQYGYETSRMRAWLLKLAALFTIAMPFRAERHADSDLRSYSLFVSHGPLALLPRLQARRLKLVEETLQRDGVATPAVGRIEWACGIAYGRLCTYALNRLALVTGFLHLQRQREWVELL